MSNVLHTPSSDDIILTCADGRLSRGEDTFVPASDTDFVAVCTDADGDKWALFPVAERDDRGEVMSVHWQRGSVEPIYRIRKRKPQMLVRDEIVADRHAVLGLCWQSFDGLFALREAVRPHTTKAECATGPDQSPGEVP